MSKAEELIKTIDEHLENSGGMYGLELANSDLGIIREALSKMVAVKVTDIHVDEYYCPVCGTENTCDQCVVFDSYCPECGQRFKKEEREEI